MLSAKKEVKLSCWLSVLQLVTVICIYSMWVWTEWKKHPDTKMQISILNNTNLSQGDIHIGRCSMYITIKDRKAEMTFQMLELESAWHFLSSSYFEGSTVVQWLALLPQCKKVVGLKPSLRRAFLRRVYMFSLPVLVLLPPTIQRHAKEKMLG